MVRVPGALGIFRQSVELTKAQSGPIMGWQCQLSLVLLQYDGSLRGVTQVVRCAVGNSARTVAVSR
jgi:hypothetical protein